MRANTQLPYLIAGVHDVHVALSAAHVQQIVKVPVWHVVPHQPTHYRGLIDFRGRTIPLLDLRLRMGMTSALAEADAMIAMLNAREQDHVRWLEALERAVRDGEAFTLARDPTKCAFGKWFYSYNATDLGFRSVMGQFELPHRVIHGIADAALDFVAAGHRDRAIELIDRTRHGELRQVRALFSDAREAYLNSRNELAVVLMDGAALFAVTVDRVASCETLDEEASDDTRSLLGGFRSDCVSTVFRRRNDRGLAYLLEPSQLLASAEVALAATA